MKRSLPFALMTLFSLILAGFSSSAQAQTKKDTAVVQLYGVVMTTDSLVAIPGASVIVEGKGRGTISNDHGIFSIVVLKGDRIRFSSIGFKDVIVTIPRNLKGSDYSLIELMPNDTAYLPATVLRPRPTREQFERDFVNIRVADDQIEIARQNTDETKRRILLATLPADGREAANRQLRQQAQRYYYQGQQPPINLLNPAAWMDFIDAWKRGDFKRKD